MWSYLCCVTFTIYKDKSKDTESSRKSPPFGGSKLKKGLWWDTKFSSVQFSRSVMFDSLRPHELQHARPPRPSQTPRVYSNSCPLSQWCHPTVWSSFVPFFSHLQSFPASGSFQMSQFFASCGQNIGASASASVLPMNIQEWFPLGWTDRISLLSKGLSRVFSNTTAQKVQKHQFFRSQLSLYSKSHIHTGHLEKPYHWLDGLCWQSNVSAF